MQSLMIPSSIVLSKLCPLNFQGIPFNSHTFWSINLKINKVWSLITRNNYIHAKYDSTSAKVQHNFVFKIPIRALLFAPWPWKSTIGTLDYITHPSCIGPVVQLLWFLRVFFPIFIPTKTFTPTNLKSHMRIPQYQYD